MTPETPSLVPELLVGSLTQSLDFWCRICGFTVEYQREEDGFAYISRGSSHLMLEQQGVIRNWITAPLERPFGRGINFQISVPDLPTILIALEDAEVPLFMELEEKWYRVSPSEETGVQQFLVEDPDGYLIRFQSSLGKRQLSS